jgi:Tfp pilus assembly protein PilX
MYLVHKIKKDSEKGFVLIAALMGIMILLAVGFLALTVTTGDMKIASRLIGERKAFSAAEAGVHELCRNFNWQASTGVSNFYFDAANDPTVRYSYPIPDRNSSMPSVPAKGYDLTKSYTSAVFDTVVTGEDTAYGSKTEIAVGTATAPSPSDTQQGTN